MRQGFKGWQIPDGIQTAQGWSGVRRAGTLSAVLNRRNGCARVGNKISMTFWCHAGGLGVLKGAARTPFQASRDDAVLPRGTDGLLHSGTLAGWAVIRTGFVGRGKQAGRRPAALPFPYGVGCNGRGCPRPCQARYGTAVPTRRRRERSYIHSLPSTRERGYAKKIFFETLFPPSAARRKPQFT